MISIIPSEVPHHKFHQYLLGSIAPRPIAFASTVDARGRPNLSPFSFFNVFGYNPSTLIFSPSRRGRDNTTKDTYENLKAVPEAVINVVTFDMVNQVSLASSEYPKGVNEFAKSGFTMLPSEKVRPFRVRESPVQMECKVRQIIETGEEGGAGMLVICEILVMHINENVLGADGLPDPNKLKLVGRLGKDYYIKAFGDGLFEVEKPLRTLGIGIDSLPEKVRNSGLLSGNELGRLGNLESLPAMDEIERIKSDEMVVKIMEQVPDQGNALALYAKQLLADGKVREALCVLLI